MKPDGSLIIKQIKVYFPLILPSVCPLASLLWMSEANICKNNLWICSFRIWTRQSSIRITGRERDWNIWYGLYVSDRVIIPFLAILHIISLPPNVWPIMEMLKLQKCCGQWYTMAIAKGWEMFKYKYKCKEILSFNFFVCWIVQFIFFILFKCYFMLLLDRKIMVNNK